MAEEKKSKAIIYIVIAVIVIIIIFALAGNSNNNSFIMYPVFCQDWFTTTAPIKPAPPAIQDFDNCHTPKALNRQVFTVDTSKNEVIETSPDSSDVIKLDYCTIQDGQHWSCGSGDFSKMPGGILSATQINSSGNNFSEYGLTNVIFVTKLQWDSINNGTPTPGQN